MGAEDELVTRAGEPVAERRGVLNELEYAGLGCKRDDLVAADAEIAVPGLAIAPKDDVHEVEDLLHHGILPEVVVSFALELYGWSSARAGCSGA